MKKSKLMVSCVFICLGVLVAINPLTGQCASSLPEVLKFATPGMGTAFNATASGVAKVISDNSPITVVVTPTSGPPAWVPGMNQSGSPSLGIESLPIIWQMWTGKPAPDPLPKGFPPKPPYAKSPNMRILVTVKAIHVGMLVRKDSGMRTISDLKGKRVAWDWPAFPQGVPITLANLFNGGLSLDDIVPVSVTEVVSAVRAVSDKRVDSTMCAVGMGAVSEADAMVGVRYLKNSMDPTMIKLGQAVQPGAYPILVPPGPAGIPEETPVWSFTTAILTSKHLSEEAAYLMVKTLSEHHQKLWPFHIILNGVRVQDFVNKNITMPYHEGAVKYFKEKGLWNEEMQKIQEGLLSK